MLRHSWVLVGLAGCTDVPPARPPEAGATFHALPEERAASTPFSMFAKSDGFTGEAPIELRGTLNFPDGIAPLDMKATPAAWAEGVCARFIETGCTCHPVSTMPAALHVDLASCPGEMTGMIGLQFTEEGEPDGDARIGRVGVTIDRLSVPSITITRAGGTFTTTDGRRFQSDGAALDDGGPLVEHQPSRKVPPIGRANGISSAADGYRAFTGFVHVIGCLFGSRC